MAIQPRVLRGRQYRRREHTFARGWFQAGAREERFRGRWTGRRAGLPWQRSTELETLGPALDGFGSLGRRRSRGTGREGSEEGRYATATATATARAPGSGHGRDGSPCRVSGACSASAPLSCWLSSSLSPSPVPTALSLLRLTVRWMMNALIVRAFCNQIRKAYDHRAIWKMKMAIVGRLPCVLPYTFSACLARRMPSLFSVPRKSSFLSGSASLSGEAVLFRVCHVGFVFSIFLQTGFGDD